MRGATGDDQPEAVRCAIFGPTYGDHKSPGYAMMPARRAGLGRVHHPSEQVREYRKHLHSVATQDSTRRKMLGYYAALQDDSK